MNKTFIVAASILALTAGVADARSHKPRYTSSATSFLASLPGDALISSNLKGQNIYDKDEKKIGELEDLIIDTSGNVRAVIVSVGGFLGVGEKYVAVPFRAVMATQREGKWWLSMDTTKDLLSGAKGYKYDKVSGAWTIVAD